MANVYRAYDPGIDRVLAIKVLKREFSRNPDAAARFLREAKAAGALSHPNIVTIYDVGEIDGFPYIAMELLDGRSLDQVQGEGALSTDAVLDIAVQLANALSYAHGQGVIHRDIKPSNIMLGKDGRSIKILDFGIARVAENSEAAHLRTQIGQVVGTPRYMSPEQALGRDLDGRSDLFSVGVVLYEIITGRPAFNGSSAATLALQITQQEPPPIQGLSPACPRGLQYIVAKLLSKRPEKRFASGALLLDALRREKHERESVAAEGQARRLPLRARLAIAMTAITAIVLAVSISTILTRQTAAMERVAITSGSSIAAFVANNAALAAIENAALPPAEQDWLPVQAFINTAAADPNVSQMMVVDNAGLIRAATDPALVGALYLRPTTQRLVRSGADISVTTMRGSDGTESFRFAHPIIYAGRQVGLVDVSVRNSELRAASSLSAVLLFGLGALTLLVVMGMSFTAARLVAQPIRRLKAALTDAALGDLDFRISHQRKDEFGELFDAFNLFAASVQERLEQAPPVAGLDSTRVGGLAPANDDMLAPQDRSA